MNELFKNKGIKCTKQREKVLSIINEKPVTIKEILDSKEDIDTSTVYRILELFLEKELIIKIVDGSEVYYAVNDTHSHYVNCIKCHKKEKINYCYMEKMEDKIEKDLGYTLVSHNLIIDGICPKCKKA